MSKEGDNTMFQIMGFSCYGLSIILGVNLDSDLKSIWKSSPSIDSIVVTSNCIRDGFVSLPLEMPRPSWILEDCLPVSVLPAEWHARLKCLLPGQ